MLNALIILVTGIVLLPVVIIAFLIVSTHMKIAIGNIRLRSILSQKDQLTKEELNALFDALKHTNELLESLKLEQFRRGIEKTRGLLEQILE